MSGTTSSTGQDPYGALGDQELMDVYLTGVTAGAATVYMQFAPHAPPGDAMLHAKTLAANVATDPATQRSILANLRQPATVVTDPRDHTPFSVREVPSAEGGSR